MERYDLIILGGGAGGFAAAIRANELGTKAALVNSGLPFGGTCVNVGCVPSKFLLWVGEIMHLAENHGIPGLKLKLDGFDFSQVVRDELRLVEHLRREKYEKVLAGLDNISVLEGEARFASKDTLKVNGEIISAEKFIIATGSTANVPPIEGIEETGYMTHIEALKLTKLPKELIIIGAGPLGLEFAQMYARFGTKVTVLERIPSIFPHTEAVLAARLAELLGKEGIVIKTGVEVISTRIENGKKTVSFKEQEETKEVNAEEILLAAGKTANTGKLNLETAGVKTDRRKSIVVSDFLQTSNPGIFAVGDVTNLPLRLEITAGREGTLACSNAITGAQDSINYSTVPYTIFTDPQLAGVGYTEKEQMKQIGSCSCRTVSFENIPKAMIQKRTEGLIKMAIHPKTNQIMGVHILAPNAGELVTTAMMLIKNKNTIDDLVGSTPMFPTLSEAFKLVALSFTKDIARLSCCT
ncbi:MAG: mercury(II) reductase [Actinobacteria bacterium]|nr:mercury(II) reductase [Actinomycetota bacterium]